MSELKYKEGDKVLIKDIDWYYENKNILGNVECGDALMTFEKTRFCGKIVTISSISDVTDTYGIEEDNGLWRWTDEMIECKVEEETKPKFKVGDRVTVRGMSGIWEIINMEDDILYTIKRENSTFTLTTYGSFLTLYEGISDKKEEMKSEDELLDEYEELTDRAFKGGYEKCKSDIELNGFQLPEGYQFVDENGNIINATKIVLEKKTVEEKYSDVKIQIFGNVVILKGGIDADNPTEYMNEVVDYILNLLGKPKYNQFIEDYLDNPWVRILIFDFNSMEFNNSFDDIINKFN